MNLERAQKIMDRIDLLAQISDRSQGISRAFGSKASEQVRQIIGGWMAEVNLKVEVDNMLNIRGLSSGEEKNIFVMGSHLDTVVNAGKFDGILGVLMALDQAERLHRAQMVMPFTFMVVGFSEEEGVRFRKPYLGSMAVSGEFDEAFLDLKDADQVQLRTVLQDHQKTTDGIAQDALPTKKTLGYLEVHIEQGPVLDQLALPIGLVTSIAGQQRHQISLLGAAGHAGTVPLLQRRDALLGASEFVVAVEKIALEYASMVATVGKLEVLPGVGNVIPEKVHLSLDVRHQNEVELHEAVDRMRTQAQKIAEKRQLVSYWESITNVSPVTCDENLTELLKQAILANGFPVKHLMSGAGHDAVPMSNLAPVSMLFVRCTDGISHNPLENTSIEDISSAVSICDNFFDNLKQSVK